MIETFPIAGVMDLDSPDLVIPRGTHRSAYNGVFRGVPGQMRFENVNGTTLVPNALLPGTGVNMTIGCRYDAVKQRLFFFNYNSAGLHGIYIYYTTVGNFVRLIETGVNTVGDPLNFFPTPRIYGIDILYGDGQSGDLLFFVDSLKRPRKLNIDRILTGGDSPVKDAYLKVIKAPPIMVPQVTYENDFTVNANNLLNCLWQFAYTFIYDDYEESVVSSASIVPLPSVQFDPSKNIPQSQSARIAVYLQTGDQNIRKIRIYGRQTTSGPGIGWQIIETLIKTDLSIADNTVYKYLFFNNGNYPVADPTFTVLLQDSVPQQANDQALLDGTTISYGGITEGYNYLNPSLNITTVNVPVPKFTVNGTLFFASLNGLFTGSQPEITLYLTGVADNDGFGNPNALYFPPQNLFVKAKSSGSDVSFSYTNAGLTNVVSILAQLQAAATGAGWIFVSNTSNSLTLYYPTGDVVLQDAFIEGFSFISQPYNLDQFAHLPQAAYQYGLVYFDIDGRTNGVISNLQGQITTQPYSSASTQITQVTLNLGGFTPPAWAAYYHVVRTDNLTYQKYFQWITDSAYGNSLAVSTQQFGYFGINNISLYNSQISATTNIVSYTFTPGDRIRITGRYAANSSFVPLNLDYPILGEATSAVDNGITKVGSFVKISYPTADISANFKLDGTPDFQNYQIIIYSYKAQNPTGLNVFNEIGQEYGIGNPGTGAAYHMGNVGDNQVSITDGDVFYRIRDIPTGSVYNVPTGGFIQGTPYSTDWINPGGNNVPVVDNGQWSIVGDVNKAAGLLSTQYPFNSSTGWTFFNEGSITLQVRFEYSFTVRDTTDPNGQFATYLKVCNSGGSVTLYNVVPLQTGLVVGAINSYSFDVTINIPAGAKLWIVNFAQNQMFVQGNILTITVVRNISLSVFDYSYSDIYNLVTNSDNRPNIVDTTALQTYFSTLFRFSEPYQLGTNINNTNRFFPNNFDEFDKSYGDIIRVRVRQREMRVFQKRRCGRVGIYQKFIKNNAGDNQLIVSDTIITQNNIQYFEGEWGIGNQPDSLSSSGYADYFADPVKGFFCRLSMDGIIPISELYKCQTFAGQNLPNYLKQYNYQFGGNAVVLSVFNFLPDRDSEVIFALQGGTQGLSTIPGLSISFNERQNAFQNFYNFTPDSIVCCENLLYSFFNGNMYTHNNTTTYANFYGVQYDASINPIYKDPILEKKTFLSMTEVSNVAWHCPSLYTNTFSYGTTAQQSNLVTEDFTLLGTDWNAPFWFDQNSQGGLINGDPLQANLISIQFVPTDSSVFSYLSTVSIRFIDSPLTVK